MDVQASGGGDKTLRRIVALFVSLAVLAERAAGRSFPVRFLVLCFLRRAEIVATGYVLEGHGVPPSACVENAAAGNDPADALLLAARFRALAAALVLLLPAGSSRDCRPARLGSLGEKVLPDASHGLKLAPNDTS